MDDLKLNTTQEQRYQVIEELRKEGIDPYGQRFDRTHSSIEAKEYYEQLAKDVPEEEKEHFTTPDVKVAGRIIGKRDQGKTIFMNIMDMVGRIQLYIRKDVLGEENYAILKKKIYAGDIIGVEGGCFKTKTGEISIRVKTVTLLSKSINPLPEKFHGLTDVEIRYRQRYVDLIANPEVRETLIKRSRIIKCIRDFMWSKGFIEVETPMLHPVAGGAAARPFITHHNTLDMEMYLRIAPELYLKRLLVGGFEKVFELNRSFRNEGIDTTHNPEFTMMECYQAYGNMETVLELAEEVISNAAQLFYKDLQVPYQGKVINLSRPWKRASMLQLVRDVTGCQELTYSSPREQLVELAKKLNVEFEEKDTAVKIMGKIFDEKIEATLIEPTFVVEYPKEISPLAKANREKPDTCDRFELFINGKEFANAFSELNDSEDQLARFEAQIEQRKAGDDEAHEMDSDYVNALRYGMPPAGGLGIGIDRVIMLLTDSASIRDIIAFPTLKKIVANPNSKPAEEE